MGQPRGILIAHVRQPDLQLLSVTEEAQTIEQGGYSRKLMALLSSITEYRVSTHILVMFRESFRPFILLYS